MRTPLAVIAGLLVILVAGSALGGGRAHRREPAEPIAPVAVIARRVQVLRGLRFRRVPRPVSVTAAQARRDGLHDLAQGYPARRRHADEALYTLLGLLPPGADLRRLAATVYDEQVAGYYDPSSKRLRIVRGAGTANRVESEMVIAHELTHALEDQRFGLDERLAERGDDRGLAYQALVEGSATEVMERYVAAYFTPDAALGGLLGSAFTSGTGDLPRFIVDQLTFPYLSGQAFVADLRRRAGGRWTLVDLADRVRPPQSSEQLLHPQKWLDAEAPDRVRLGRLGRRPGAGYGRLEAGTLGEWLTGELLALAPGGRPGGGTGWGGDRYVLWRRDPGTPCRTPCTSRDVLVVRWRWDSAAAARRFAPALRAAVAAQPRHGGVAAVRSGPGATTTLVLAPDARTAARAAT